MTKYSMKITPEEFKQMSEEEKVEYMDTIKHEVTIYSILDKVAQEYGALVLNNKGDAVMVRDFNELMNDEKQVNFYNHPGDYELWKMGKYNTKTGEIESNPSLICNGAQAVQMRLTKNATAN